MHHPLTELGHVTVRAIGWNSTGTSSSHRWVQWCFICCDFQ